MSTVPFLFYSFLFPFSQRNKDIEIIGPLVLVTNMGVRRAPCQGLVSSLPSGKVLITGHGVSVGSAAGRGLEGPRGVAGQQSPVVSLVSQTLAEYVVVKSRCLGTRLPGSKSQVLSINSCVTVSRLPSLSELSFVLCKMEITRI